MPYYKNIGYHPVAYHGVCCDVGDVALFPAYVVDSCLIPCDKPRTVRKIRTNKRNKLSVSDKVCEKKTDVTSSSGVSMFDAESELKKPEVNATDEG